MLMFASMQKSDGFDHVTGFKLVDYVPRRKCGGCGKWANDWRKGSTQDSQVRQSVAFDAIVARFSEKCPCGARWKDE
jgi:hypothetical protein